MAFRSLFGAMGWHLSHDERETICAALTFYLALRDVDQEHRQAAHRSRGNEPDGLPTADIAEL